MADSTETYLQLAWDNNPHIKIGAGYDFAKRKLKGSALDNVPSASRREGQRNVSDNIHSISTDKELKQRIEADLEAAAPVEGVYVQTQNSYLTSIQTSDTSLTRVIQVTIKDPPSKIDEAQVQLTERARKILAGPDGWKQFTERYGEYFVYGYVPLAKFSAVCNIKTSDKRVRDQVKTKLSGNFAEVADAGAALHSVAQNKQDSVLIDVSLEITGLQNNVGTETESDNATESGPKTAQTNQIDQVQEEYNNFRKNIQTVPFTALLCHYSVLEKEAGIPPPTDQFRYLGPDIGSVYKKLYTAQIELSMSIMSETSDTSNRISRLCEKVNTLDLTQKHVIADFHKNVQSCLEEVNVWQLRSELLYEVAKRRYDGLNWGNWTVAGTEDHWRSGMLGIDSKSDPQGKYHDLQGEVSHKWQEYRSQWSVGHSYHDVSLGGSDKMIIGFKIINKWADGTNGWFQMQHGNVLDPYIKLQICSEANRGCRWEVEVWMVDKFLYGRKEGGS